MERRKRLARFRPTHGAKCACDDCLIEWAEFVRSDYKMSFVIRPLSDPDLLLVRWDTRQYLDRDVWQRDDLLAWVKAWARHADFSRRYEDKTGKQPLVRL